MNAGDILRLLSEKHAKDVFVAECKDGSSWGGHLRMDAWAMARSWAHPCMYGYEIKVSRSDFLNDNKWPGYLPLCNRFSFVAVRGIIQPQELPANVGLLEVASTGTSLRTVRKSAHREIEPPAELLKYILMCRSKICAARFGIMEDDDPAEFWRAWLMKKQDARDIGYRVSQRLRQLIAEQIDTVQCENRRLVTENQQLQKAKGILGQLGVHPGSWRLEDEIQYKLQKARDVVSPEVIQLLKHAAQSIQDAVQQLDQEAEQARKGKEVGLMEHR